MRRERAWPALRIGGMVVAIVLGATAAGQTPLATLRGADFEGGAAERFGSQYFGAEVNYVYAIPHGSRSEMRAILALVSEPPGDLYLYVRARDDDGPGRCRVEITVNDEPLFAGANPFASDRWETRRFALPGRAVHRGENVVRVRNTEQEGDLGQPPWFMVAGAAIGPAACMWQADITQEFRVVLPEAQREIPEPVAQGQEPGFPLRGIKGWLWSPEQYLEELPHLAEYKLNFLMNCYGSMCDIEHFPWGDSRVNRWWEPLPDGKRRAYEEVIRESRRLGIEYCFSMNPCILTERIVRYESDEDLDLLWRHYAWAQSQGVKWFNISLDDISRGIDPIGQARMVNEFLRRARCAGREAQMIFCPTYYWGDGSEEPARSYLEALARELDPDVYVFWTGDKVVGPVTRAAAESYRGIVRHRLFLWNNYPVNDANPTMHLGPVVGLDPDLCEVIDGYMSNPMHSQNRINRIPLMTCADYAYNPRAYDPARSIGQAILHFGADRQRRAVLKDLVEAYPGMLLFDSGTSFNAVRDRCRRLLAMPHGGAVAEVYLGHLLDVSEKLKRELPELTAARQTLDGDVAWCRQLLRERLGPWTP